MLAASNPFLEKIENFGPGEANVLVPERRWTNVTVYAANAGSTWLWRGLRSTIWQAVMPRFGREGSRSVEVDEPSRRAAQARILPFGGAPSGDFQGDRLDPARRGEAVSYPLSADPRSSGRRARRCAARASRRSAPRSPRGGCGAGTGGRARRGGRYGARARGNPSRRPRSRR